MQHWRRVVANQAHTLMTSAALVTCIMMSIGRHSSPFRQVELKAPLLIMINDEKEFFPGNGPWASSKHTPEELLRESTTRIRFEDGDIDGDGKIDQLEWMMHIHGKCDLSLHE